MTLPSSPGSSRGQSTLEAIGLALAVSALVATLAIVRPSFVAEVAGLVVRAFGVESAAEPPRRPTSFAELPTEVQRFVLHAVAGAPDGTAPTLADAELRLRGLLLDRETATDTVEQLAWSNLVAQAPWVAPGGATYRAVGPTPDLRSPSSRWTGLGELPDDDAGVFWSTERARSRAVHLTVTSADDERRLLQALEPGWLDRVEAMVVETGKVIVGTIYPMAGLALVGVDAAEAGVTRDPATAIPPGAREGDLTFCLEVERTNHAGPSGERMPHAVAALRPGEPIRLVRLAIVRDGRLLAEGLANEEHCA